MNWWAGIGPRASTSPYTQTWEAPVRRPDPPSGPISHQLACVVSLISGGTVEVRASPMFIGQGDRPIRLGRSPLGYVKDRPPIVGLMSNSDTRHTAAR
jgi:hypothetical protein